MSLTLGATLQPPSKRLEAKEQERQEVHARIDAELHTVGLEHFSEAIAQRMELIELLAAPFNNDSRMIRRICLEVLDRIASTLEPQLQSKLDADSRRDMSIAAYLHDIGKSGPFDASQETQEAIVKLYAVENVAILIRRLPRRRARTSLPRRQRAYSSVLAHAACVQLTRCAHSGIAMVTGRTTFSKLTRKTYRFGRGLSRGAIIWIGE